MHVLGFLALTALTGCTAQMVAPARTNSRNAPVNEASRLGLVKYSTDGAGFVVRRRRENAYKQMAENCGGPYRIVDEGQQVDGGVVVSTTTTTRDVTVTEKEKQTDARADAATSTVTTASDLHYWYIQYQCTSG
jgi:hypothetical protein